ncbi:hypothetical protein [Streptomyces sp. SBT349]|uniref:hypothetical protein n=1 Tax=Streptomyces sp. SBT349 TaxID=1580539 RepID=UPI00066EC44D|nr:hypothetical protein [Streptomyces sp. SBT349]
MPDVVLDAVADDHRREAVEIAYSEEPPFVLRLRRGPDAAPVSFEATNLFAGLTKLRAHLEADGLVLCCQGARPDVTPSGLENQMSGGRYVYTFTPGTRAVNQEYVDIFAPAAREDVVTVAEQRAAVLAFHGLPDTGWQPS